MIFNNQKKPLVSSPISLYKWAKIFNHLQRNFFEDDDIKLRREKQIEDFIYLNEFKVVKIISDTDVFLAPEHPFERCDNSADADIVVITDQKFSRYPCHVMPERIKYYLDNCPNLYLCLNRHYINIDNSFHDTSLSDNYNLAITQWLRKSLPEYQIIDMSLDYVNDNGFYFSWVVPDRHYYITKK
jgi:hypothetical protein